MLPGMKYWIALLDMWYADLDAPRQVIQVFFILNNMDPEYFRPANEDNLISFICQLRKHHKNLIELPIADVYDYLEHYIYPSELSLIDRLEKLWGPQ